MSPGLPAWDQVAVDRFFSKVTENGVAAGCWLWTAARRYDGYGIYGIQGKTHYAHRWAFELLRTEIPSGLHLDHLCRVKHCCNPWHLEPVTSRENFLRGQAPGAVALRTGLCQRGHSMADAYVRPRTGYRECATCRRERQARSVRPEIMRAIRRYAA